MEAAKETKSPVIIQASRGARQFAQDRYLFHLILAASELYPDIPIAMITSDGEQHKRGRRIAAPAFHRRRIERYAGQIVDLSATLCSEWKPGQQLDIAAEMMRLALQVTARTLFDTEVTPEIHADAYQRPACCD